MRAVSIVVHGGAGPRSDDDLAEAAKAGCLAAAAAGHALLLRGGSALDAVEAAARILEDDPAFNAGTGAALNQDGDVELDAAVMEGQALRAGAVAAVRGIRNPVLLARAVMEHSPHAFLVAEGARRFARAQGFSEVDPKTLVTERALARWKKAAASTPARLAPGGTIGAVAVDLLGHVAAATSTGGTPRKLAGRVGDSPIIGAGTYADDLGGAASCTGHGESILKVVLAKRAVDLCRAGASARRAAREALAELGRVGGEGGLIVVDRHAQLGMAFNAERMARAWVDATGRRGAAFGRDDLVQK